MRSGQIAKLGNKFALGVIVLGLLLIALGYNGAAGNLAIAAQVPYILSGGLGGIALVIVGAALMITQSAREDRQRVETLLQQLVDAQAEAVPAQRVPSDADGLFAAGTSSFHLPTCRLVDGRDEVSYVTYDEAAERELKACRVCQPVSAPASRGVRIR